MASRQFENLVKKHGHEEFSIVVGAFRLNLADPKQRQLYDLIEGWRDAGIGIGPALATVVHEQLEAHDSAGNGTDNGDLLRAIEELARIVKSNGVSMPTPEPVAEGGYQKVSDETSSGFRDRILQVSRDL